MPKILGPSRRISLLHLTSAVAALAAVVGGVAAPAMAQKPGTSGCAPLSFSASRGRGSLRSMLIRIRIPGSWAIRCCGP